MVNERLIRAAEQEVRDLERKYSESVATLRLRIPRSTFRGLHILLGQIDGIPVVEVDMERRSKIEGDRVQKKAVYNGQEYVLLCRDLPWYGYGPMRRAVRVSTPEMPHVFGVPRVVGYDQTEIGIYVQPESLALAQKRHTEEVLYDYPAIQVGINQLKGLNISPDFVYRIDAQMDLKLGKNRLMDHAVFVKPVTNGTDYGGRRFELPEELTEFQITHLKGPLINLKDFYEGAAKRPDRLEDIREAIGAVCYLSTRGHRWDVHTYSFRFNKVLSNQEVAAALQRLGKVKGNSYMLTLFRLSDQLRELVNIPLDQAIPSSLVKRYVEQDFPADQSPVDERYLSLSIF
jgi:hypothetical protein